MPRNAWSPKRERALSGVYKAQLQRAVDAKKR